MSDTQRCRSCGVDILWMMTKNGKAMPLDANSEKRFILVPDRYGVHAESKDTYVSHFSTCPNADKHRKKES